MTQVVYLKWGTWKGHSGLSEENQDLFRKYAEMGTSLSAMAQRDTGEQKEVLCQLIDSVDVVKNEWSGEAMTKEEAKEYVREYSKK